MASYHSSFTYNEKNSFDEGYIIAAFEPDSGFMDSFLTMENISDEYYDGTKRFDYGSKYVSSPEIKITLIKKDGSDMKLNEFRACAKWLTGARINSWLDMYVGDEIIYSFLGKFLGLEHYKLDSRTIGVRLTFSSVSPWAYSRPQFFDGSFGQAIEMNESGLVFTTDEEVSMLGINSKGVLCPSPTDTENSCFEITEEGVAYIDTSYNVYTDNKTDDLYSYIYLDIDCKNTTGGSIYIENKTLNEKTIINGISPNENVSLSAKQFITSDIPNKIFGDDFNFIWPRLAPGLNEFTIYGSGIGNANFTYRYPMKIGDCVIDSDIMGNLNCGCSGGNNSGGGSIAECTINPEELYAMLNNLLK